MRPAGRAKGRSHAPDPAARAQPAPDRKSNRIGHGSVRARGLGSRRSRARIWLFCRLLLTSQRKRNERCDSERHQYARERALRSGCRTAAARRRGARCAAVSIPRDTEIAGLGWHPAACILVACILVACIHGARIYGACIHGPIVAGIRIQVTRVRVAWARRHLASATGSRGVVQAALTADGHRSDVVIPGAVLRGRRQCVRESDGRRERKQQGGSEERGPSGR